MKTTLLPNKGIRKSILLLATLCLLLAFLQSCNDADDPVPAIDFDYLSVVNDAQVSESTIAYYDDGSSDLTLKFFDVHNSADIQRPLIILAPGGGWTKYNQVDELEALATDLAKRGYALAVVNYTVNQQNGETWLKSIKDFKVAIKFFKKYADDYNIDPENIFTGGWSTGAQLAMYAQHLELEEYENFSQSLIHTILDPEIDRLGYEPSIYPEYANDVKGNLLLMPFSWKEDFLDNEGPTMMIANERSTFNDGTQIWGEDIVAGGLTHQGPDMMKVKFEELGLTEGKDLEWIITDPSLDTEVSHINYTPLHASHYNAIADFLKRNL